MTDLRFPDRAVNAFVEAASKGIVSPSYVKRILKYKKQNVDVSSVEPLLKDDNPFIRKMAARVIGQMGNIKKIVELAKDEEDRNVLFEIIEQLSKRKEDIVEELVFLLDNDDKATRQLVISMFRRAGRADCLINLLFDDDDELVQRVRIWMEEAEQEET